MCRVLNILLAVLSRVLFALHGFVTVCCVVAVHWLEKHKNIYWLLLIGVALLGVEMIITIKYTSNAEWKWFSPMVFLYLSTTIPSIWILELNWTSQNNSSGNCQKNTEETVKPLAQTMIIVLVLGRWLMPKGDMSRDQLSQLLMIYVGLGADILDILDILDTIKYCNEKNYVLIIVGLSLFSWALMQFSLVLTQTNPTKIQTKIHFKPTSPYNSCCSSEIWSLLLTVGLQDGPFLVYRLYLMIKERVVNEDIIFFTCKNILTVMLELYRIGVVYFELHRPRGRERSPDEPQRQTERVEVLESS